jgi:hypothetical protein
MRDSTQEIVKTKDLFSLMTAVCTLIRMTNKPTKSQLQYLRKFWADRQREYLLRHPEQKLKKAERERKRAAARRKEAARDAQK